MHVYSVRMAEGMWLVYEEPGFEPMAVESEHP